MGEERDHLNYRYLQNSWWWWRLRFHPQKPKFGDLVYLSLSCVETVEAELLSFVSLITSMTEALYKEKWVFTSVAHNKYWFLIHVFCLGFSMKVSAILFCITYFLLLQGVSLICCLLFSFLCSLFSWVLEVSFVMFVILALPPRDTSSIN